MKGWECPKCGNVYSPNVQECSACNKKNVVWIPNPYTARDWIYMPPIVPVMKEYPWPHYEVTCVGATGSNTGHATGAPCV